MKYSTIQIFTLLLLITLAVPAFASKVLADIEYFYADDGTLIGKAFNGKRVNYEYDLRGQLLAVKDASGNDLERYTYDPAGNRLSKTINGVTTTYSYDEANQLIRSTVNGEITYYEYDAAGRMIQAGDKSYIYNGNNKVIEVRQNGETIAKFEYNIDGQIAKAIYGDKKEEFIWDGLALIWRSGVTYINEPYVTGGNPVMAGDDVLFNDMLGSTLAVNDKAVEMTSFGETDNENVFFTGKPMIDELGYSFLFRDYNPNQGKWTTSDPLGYPDGWNQLAYCNNGVTSAVDLWGCKEIVLLGEVDHSGRHVATVWAECNHNYNKPEFTIHVGQLKDHPDNKYVKASVDGKTNIPATPNFSYVTMYAYTDADITHHVTLENFKLVVNVVVPVDELFNKKIMWEYQVEFDVKDEWEENSELKKKTRVEKQENVYGRHFIEE